MTSRSLTLANGLRCHLHHQPGTRQAAALIRVEAGSLDEEDDWPGVAHLLEHLLFHDSAHFSSGEGLMPWVQRQGGQVNATTQLSRSAFFFQTAAPVLDSGLQRLCDMLATPLLTSQAIHQEINVIDAEYRLLQNHPETLSMAALFDTLPGRFQRFRVGSRAAFGDNAAALQSALRRFHHRFYHAGNMQLWLQGPQSLDELAQLAERDGAMLPGGHAEPTIARLSTTLSHDVQIQLDGEETFWLTLMLDSTCPTLYGDIALLSAFWLDEAPGSLMAQLRAERLCESLCVQWLWQDAYHAWLGLRFNATDLKPETNRRIEAYFWQYLAQIAACEPAVPEHYIRLARQDFTALSPLEQLRGRALTFAPTPFPPADLHHVIEALTRAPRSRLLTQRRLAGKVYQTQGFTLRGQSILPVPFIACPAIKFSFYPGTDAGLNATPSSSMLLLRPAFYQRISDDEALAREHLLRPLLAALRHAGGSGRWRQTGNVWQLELCFSETQAATESSLQSILQALHQAEVAMTRARPSPDIAIRRLLNALPDQLVTATTHPAWLAIRYGEEAELPWPAGINQRLRAFPLNPTPPAKPPQLRRGITSVICPGSDSALLLFIPLERPDDDELAALCALGLMAEPRFFKRLRVDQQIGYVVSARYQRVSDVDGLLLALQSPDIPWRKLFRHCQDFLHDLFAGTNKPAAADLASWQATLLGLCDARDSLDAATHALRQRYGLPCLTRTAINNLTLAQIQQLHQRHILARHRWQVIIAQREKTPPCSD